ncbi:hypothetical protein I311_00529, partial [Cryptococcus gattii NT-10]
VTLTKATGVFSGKASSAAPLVSATGTGSSSSKMGVSWPIQEKDASSIAQFFLMLFQSFDRTFFDNSDSLQDGFTEIMGYNEPDIIGSWKTQITKLRSTYPSIKVQSPVMAFNQTWLSTFFATICPPPYSSKDGWSDCSYKPDYVAMHLYTTDPDEFMSTVSTFQKTFGLPLVLSEFACYRFGSNSNPSAADVSTFMQKTISWLEKQSWLVRYAWFDAVRDSTYLYGVAETNRLMDPTGQLTNLGKQYMNGGQLL